LNTKLRDLYKIPTFDDMDFLTVKALHLIFVVSWFAGLFYIVRLFIYHIESLDKPESEGQVLRNQFKIMERKLWYIITWPAMILTLVFGIWMLVLMPSYLFQPWMHLKLGFLVILVIYHLICHQFYRQIQKDIYRWSSTGLRIWNEVATLLLVAIIFVVVLKSSLDWIWGTVGFFLVAIGLMIAVKLYKRIRQRKEGFIK
jgi:protoporphyrinogen IX oxidase